MELKRCAVSIGGNEKRSRQKLQDVYNFLEEEADFKEVQLSSLLITDPISSQLQDPFFNGAATFQTALSPEQLFEKLEAFEKKLGKKKKPKWAPRPIDIDLIFHGKSILEEKTLTLPHPLWLEREFVILPLMELIDKVAIGDRSFSLHHYYKKFHHRLKGKKL